MRNPVDELNKKLAEMQSLFAEFLSAPDTVGWLRLIELLKEAAKDKDVRASKGASEFLALMLRLVRESSPGSTADDVMQPVAGQSRAKNSSKASQKRFEKHRDAERWVVSEWLKDKSEYKSKAEFARIYTKRVLNEYGITIRERNLIERWLKDL